MNKVVKISILILFFLLANCTRLEKHNIFDNKSGVFIYEDILNHDNKKRVTISYNDSLSRIKKKECYMFQSTFLNGYIYKENEKIYFLNKYEIVDYLLFDFSGKIGQTTEICLSKKKFCYYYTLNSITLDSTFIYERHKKENQEFPQLTSPYGVKYLYVNQKRGIVKIMEETSVDLSTFNLK